MPPSDEIPSEILPTRFRVAAPLPAAVGGDWSEGEGFQTAVPSAALTAWAEAALNSQGLTLDGAVLLVRHQAGGAGLPASASDGQVGFALDLADARRTLDGGLLMFVEDSGRVAGWRAETGALTLWRGSDPLITELAPGSPDRLTLIGRARPL